MATIKVISEEERVELIDLTRDAQIITVDMFPLICRICFSNENLRGIHEKYDNNTLSPYEIFHHFGLNEASVVNQLPQHICENCTEKLFEMYTILDFCKKSHKTLKEVLKNSKNKVAKKSTKQVIKKSMPNISEHNYSETVTSVREEQQGKKVDEEDNDVITVFEINYEDGNEFGEVLQKFELNADDPIFEENDYETIKIEYEADPLENERASKDDEGVYSCPHCPAIFKSASNFSRHKYVHTQDKPHKCHLCEKSFTRKEALQIHVRRHTGEKQHVCQICNKEFTIKSNYNAHMMQHDLESGNLSIEEANAVLETITCKLCNKKFSSKHTLKAHMLLHQPKLHTCDICSKQFTFKGNLISHYRSHTGEKPYQCEHCDKSFTYKMGLKEHTYTHTGERPHICKYCGKGFIQQQQLKTHIRTHTGERPFTCGYCGKTFANKVNMTVHERIHTGTTPYVCPLCDKGFYDSSSLKKHRKRHDISLEPMLPTLS